MLHICSASTRGFFPCKEPPNTHTHSHTPVAFFHSLYYKVQTLLSFANLFWWYISAYRACAMHQALAHSVYAAKSLMPDSARHAS